MWRRLLAILGLVGLAVTQPVLDLLGSSPATFERFGIEGYSIIWFAVLVTVIPGLVVWSFGEVIHAIDTTAGEWVHRVTIGLLAAGFGVLLAKAISSSTVVAVVVAIVVGTGVALLVERTEAMGMWLRLMAAANLLFLAQFAFLSPAADWVESATSTPDIIVPVQLDPVDDAPTYTDAVSAAPSSVFIITFDELPSQTLIDENGEIDAEQFPAFASLAADGTHYQRHTTNSAFTHAAVPALFDGKEPQGGQTWTEHPENLFNIFAGTHHLIVSEVVTRLCGFDVCDELTPPPPPDRDATTTHDATTDTPSTTTLEPVETPGGSSGSDWRGLIDATWDVWVDRLSPVTSDEALALDEFQEDFGAAATTGATTSSSIPPSSAEPADAADDDQSPQLTVPPDDERTDAEAEQDALELFFRVQPGAQPERFTEFLAAVQPSDDPVFGFLHLILPHQPWIVREDGTLYDFAAGRVDFGADNASEWPVRVTRQRHVLQTRYTDQILGQFLDHLRAQGYYDDALIVVVGDHGVSFEPGESSRDLSPGGLPSVAYTPLLIKAPGQTEGRIDDTNVSIVDIPVTIADILGIGLPWDTIGAPGGSAEVAARDGAKSIYEFASSGDFDVQGVIDFDDDTAFAQLVADRHPAPTSLDDPLSALYAGIPGDELRGADADDVFGPIDGSASIEALDRLRTPGDETLLGEIAGRVRDAPDDATVIVAVNDVIVGVSPLYTRGGADDSFVVLLPADALGPAANEVRVALRTASGDIRELAIDG